MPRSAPSARIWDLPHDQAIAAAGELVTRVARRTIRGTLHRAVYAKFLLPPRTTRPEPLYFNGSLAGRRFTPRMGPAGLYLSFDPSTPPAELRDVVFEHGFAISTRAHAPIITVAVRVEVRRVLDLTDRDTLGALKLTADDLRSDWEAEQEKYLAGCGPMPATQILALAAHASGLITGIKYPSARTDFGVNLVVFPDRLDSTAGDLLEVADPDNLFPQRLPS